MKITYNHQAFDGKMDGIIYYAYSALGFATIENIMYAVSGFDKHGTGLEYRPYLQNPLNFNGVVFSYRLNILIK